MPPTFSGGKRHESSTKSMSIVLFLGRSVKEYIENGADKTKELINSGTIRCASCFQPMARHSSYKREIKESGQEIRITIVWCRKCKIWHALLPDFLLHNKHYSGNEIESVVADSAEAVPVSQVETEASEATVRRWIRQISERVRRAISIFKLLFGRDGQAINEVAIEAGPAYSELEQILEMAPSTIRYSGNKLGLANLWLGTSSMNAFI